MACLRRCRGQCRTCSNWQYHMSRKTALAGMASDVKVRGGTQYGQNVKAPATHLPGTTRHTGGEEAEMPESCTACGETG